MYPDIGGGWILGSFQLNSGICTTEFSQRQTTGCVELFLLACYILITRVYECILPCMYCITMSVTQNAVCNCEIKSILTYLLYLHVLQPRRLNGPKDQYWLQPNECSEAVSGSSACGCCHLANACKSKERYR